MLCNWVYPQIITDEDYVCEACWKLFIDAVNQNLQQYTANELQAGPTQSQRCHTNVCILCRCSPIQRQNEKILRDNPSELQRQMIEIIKCRKEPQQVTTSDNVCYVCWLRTKREVLYMNRLNELRVEEAIQHGDDDDVSRTEPPNESTVVENISMPKAGISLEDHQSHEDPHEQDIVRLSIQNTENGTIALPDYKRALS